VPLDEAHESLVCHRCEYALRGLAGDAACPECGTPIADSVCAWVSSGPLMLRYRQAGRWLTGFALGSILLQIVGAIVLQAFAFDCFAFALLPLGYWVRRGGREAADIAFVIMAIYTIFAGIMALVVTFNTKTIGVSGRPLPAGSAYWALPMLLLFGALTAHVTRLLWNTIRLDRRARTLRNLLRQGRENLP